MNKIYLLVFLVTVSLQSCIVSKKSNMDFISTEELTNGENITSISPPMFIAKPIIKKALLEDGDADATIIYDIIKKIKKIRILTMVLDSTKPSNLLDQKISSHIKKNHLNQLMELKQKNQRIEICADGNDKKIKNLFVAIKQPNQSVFVAVKGNFHYDDLAKLISQMSDK